MLIDKKSVLKEVQVREAVNRSLNRFSISEEGSSMVKKSDKSSEVIEAGVKTAKVRHSRPAWPTW